MNDTQAQAHARQDQVFRANQPEPMYVAPTYPKHRKIQLRASEPAQ